MAVHERLMERYILENYGYKKMTSEYKIKK